MGDPIFAGSFMLSRGWQNRYSAIQHSPVPLALWHENRPGWAGREPRRPVSVTTPVKRDRAGGVIVTLSGSMLPGYWRLFYHRRWNTAWSEGRGSKEGGGGVHIYWQVLEPINLLFLSHDNSGHSAILYSALSSPQLMSFTTNLYTT